MKEYQWNEFKYTRIAVLCDTEDKAKEFIKECYERDMTWNKHSSPLDTHWDVCKTDTCYCFSYNGSHLGYADKPFFQQANCKIIKWGSGCNMKFKVGDKVILANGQKWDGTEYRTITEIITGRFRDYCRLSDIVGAYFADDLELYKEPQTEFTFEEIHSFKDNKTYENINTADNVKTVRVTESGAIRITYANKGSEGLIIFSSARFKLKEDRKRLRICLIEHTWNGKRYEFREKEGCEVDTGDFVVCETKYGKTYGKCIGTHTTVETESKIKEYKECWRA